MIISAEAILGIAVAIENNGIEFYEKAGKTVDDASFLDFLIEEEKRHIEVFQDLFAQGGKLGQIQLDHPHLDEEALIAAYAETEVFGRESADDLGPEALIDVGIRMEKNSILFYSELIDLVDAKHQDEAKLLRQIREEERKHLKLFLDKKRAAA
mgnify:CR=1 FL=1